MKGVLNLLRLWFKELFSSLSFILSESVLMVSITILTFALVFSESMIDGTDKIISLLGGEYNIYVDNQNTNNVRDVLNEYNVSYKESKSDIALIKSEKESYIRYVKIVDESYFTDEIIKNTNVKLPLKSGLYLSNVSTKSEKFALLFSSAPRGTLVPYIGEFKTGLKTFDDNTAFYVPSKRDNTFSNITNCFEVLSNTDDSIKAISTILNNSLGVTVISKKDVNDSFYSSLSPTRRTIEFVAFLFVLLSSFYSISLIASFNDYFSLDLKFLYLFGCSKQTILIISVFSVFITMIFFIFIGFLNGVFLSYLFLPLIKAIANVTSLNLSFYFLSFSIKIPFKKLITRYLIILFMLLLISLPMFIKRKKSI